MCDSKNIVRNIVDVVFREGSFGCVDKKVFINTI